MRLTLALVLINMFASGGAAAQGMQDVEQISARASSVAIEPVTLDRTTEAAQLSPRREALPAPPQLSSKRDSGQPSQVATRLRSAQPPQPISRPSDGRISAVEAVAGTDRCDSRNEAGAAECERVIESRAAEFDRPPPTQLSPEQKLLLEQEIKVTGEDVADATRRLAASGEADGSAEAMGIASIVLGSEQGKQQPKDEKDPALNAATQAVIKFLQIQPPR